MASAWLLQVMRLDVEFGLKHRRAELIDLPRRMMKATYLQGSETTMRYGQETLDWVERNRAR